ncbi:MAG: hypothetical protein R6V43_04430 [Halopseudomonas sp.]
MDIVLTLLAVLVAGVILWDQFVTVFSTGGAGPLSQRGCQGLWHALLMVHRRRPIHRVLKYAGPAMILLSILTWYLMLGLAVFMVLAAYPGSVIDSTTKAPANAIEILYFTSTTISSLGYGEWIPSGPPWTFISTLATLAATIIVTVSLSYVLSVVSAAVERRGLAAGIFAMGKTEEEIIRNANLNDPQGSLKNYLLSLSSAIDQQGLRHLAYPVLKYFHATQPELSPARAVLLLSDTVFLLELDMSGSLKGVTGVLRSSIDNFVKFTRANSASARSVDSDKNRLAGVATTLGLDTDGADFDRAFADYSPLRHRLLSLCEADGWAVR